MRPLPRAAAHFNHLLARWNIGLRLERVVNGQVDMTTVEQRFCLVHLLTDLVRAGVEGEVVEFGCFEGKTAALLARLLHDLETPRSVAVFDSFEVSYFLGKRIDLVERVRSNFADAGVPPPRICQGKFEETIPAQLPEKVCFAHLDCGTGGDAAAHKRALLHCLTHLYPRLALGGVCALMDYNDGTFPEIDDALPSVREATLEFLADKPEKPIVMWGGQGGMAYFRRQQ